MINVKIGGFYYGTSDGPISRLIIPAVNDRLRMVYGYEFGTYNKIIQTINLGGQ